MKRGEKKRKKKKDKEREKKEASFEYNNRIYCR